jgi:hypothetical protein
MHDAGPFLFAGELHVDSAVFIARSSEPVNSKHLWASNTAEQVTDSTILIMAIPSLNTPSRPASE